MDLFEEKTLRISPRQLGSSLTTSQLEDGQNNDRLSDAYEQRSGIYRSHWFFVFLRVLLTYYSSSKHRSRIVEFIDGTACPLVTADMKPSYFLCLYYPNGRDVVESLSLAQIRSWFRRSRSSDFPCIRLAQEALANGSSSTTVLTR